MNMEKIKYLRQEYIDYHLMEYFDCVPVNNTHKQIIEKYVSGKNQKKTCRRISYVKIKYPFDIIKLQRKSN